MVIQMIGCYSPIWFDVSISWKRKPRKVTSIKFEEGERLKYCCNCDDWFPADTRFFDAANSKKIGLSSWCRCCNKSNQNTERYWHKAERAKKERLSKINVFGINL